MTIWSVEVGEHDCISRIHNEKELPPESWGMGWVNGGIVFVIIAIVIWGMR